MGPENAWMIREITIKGFQNLTCNWPDEVEVDRDQGGSGIEKKDLGSIFFFPRLWVD